MLNLQSVYILHLWHISVQMLSCIIYIQALQKLWLEKYMYIPELFQAYLKVFL